GSAGSRCGSPVHLDGECRAGARHRVCRRPELPRPVARAAAAVRELRVHGPQLLTGGTGIAIRLHAHTTAQEVSMRTLIVGLTLIAVAGCATAPRGTDITGETWTLVEMYGEPVAAGDTNRPVTLTLDADGNASGYSGCNQF